MKIGMIVPSTNVTMEKELPQMLPTAQFEVARVELKDVTPDSLRKMNEGVAEAAGEFSSKQDAVVSACLVATVMADGGHEAVEAEIQAKLDKIKSKAKVVSSAGALVRQLLKRNFTKIAMIAPYSDELTLAVIDYLAKHDIEVVDYVNFDISDNTLVGELDKSVVIDAAKLLNLYSANCLVVSACVQMPSLEAMQDPQLANLGIPMMSAAKATAIEVKNIEAN